MKTLSAWPLSSFFLLTFGFSLVLGLIAFRVGGEKTFESAAALPFLLLTIWTPTLAALAVAASEGTAKELLESLIKPSTMMTWAIALVPLAIAIGLSVITGGGEPLPFKTWGLLLGMNLIMGPLGEELGWRGFLLPRLIPTHGPLVAALIVGAVWALWHLPLWALPSPQREIPFLTFFATVVCFSLVMTVATLKGRGALGPCILFHLLANVGVGWLEASGTMNAREAYQRGLPFYGLLALIAAVWLRLPSSR